MDTHKEIALKAVQILEAARIDLNKLFRDTPQLQIRSQNTLQRLANIFAHSAGIEMKFDDINGLGAATTSGPVEKLTHVAGILIVRKAPAPKVADATPTSDEEKELQGFLETAYEDFKAFEPAELLATYNELVLRALATKVGMRVTPTEPAIIDLAFVEKLKEVIMKDVPKEPAPVPASETPKVADATPTANPAPDGAPAPEVKDDGGKNAKEEKKK